MWESDDIEGAEERLDRLFRYMTSGMDGVFFEKKTKSLRPLHSVEAAEDHLKVTFDLPRVEKKDVRFSVTASTLTIEAEMTKPIKLRLAGHHQTDMRFERYAKKIRLPETVVPKRATMKLTGGFLIFRLPLLRRSKPST